MKKDEPTDQLDAAQPVVEVPYTPAPVFAGEYPPTSYYYGYGAHCPACQHYGDAVQVGPYTIWAGGATYLKPGDLESFDLLVPLLDTMMPFGFRKRYNVLSLPLKDFGGVPPDWREGVEEVLSELKAGQRVLAFCQGGHGRTGTLLASLVALLESADETPDPIQAVRERYCDRAVETREQAAAIFALRGEALPLKYLKQFPAPVEFKAPKRKGKWRGRFFRRGR